MGVGDKDHALGRLTHQERD